MSSWKLPVLMRPYIENEGAVDLTSILCPSIGGKLYAAGPGI